MVVESVGKGLAGLVAFFVLLVVVLSHEKDREYETDLVEADPVEKANEMFDAGDIFFFEVAMLAKRNQDGDLLPVEWKVAGENQISESILTKDIKLKRLKITKNMMIELKAAQLRKKGLSFASRFNLQMAKRLESSKS